MFCVTTACVCSKQTGNFVQLDCVIRAALIFHTIRVGWQDIVAFHTTTSHYERNILLNNVLEKLERWSSTKVAMFSSRNREFTMDSNNWNFALVLATNLLTAVRLILALILKWVCIFLEFHIQIYSSEICHPFTFI